MKQYYYLIYALEGEDRRYWDGKKWGDEDNAKRYKSPKTALNAISRTVSSMEFSRLKNPTFCEGYETIHKPKTQSGE